MVHPRSRVPGADLSRLPGAALLTRSPRRIVSLLPAATEIVAALGAGDRLAGVTHECDFPPFAATLRRVTASVVDSDATAAKVDAAVSSAATAGLPLFALDVSGIRSLAPDLIITQGICDVCAVSEVDVRALAQTLEPPPAVLSLDAATLDGVLTSVVDVAAAIGAEDEGKELVAALRVRIQVIHETLRRAHAPRPRVAVIEWTDPVYGAGHWVPEMVRRAGGVDVLSSPGERSRSRAAEEIRAKSPDLLVFALCGYGLERAVSEASWLAQRSEWEWARALPKWAIDGNALTSRPGPRLCDGIETLARIFNPGLFSPLLRANARELYAP